MEEEKKQPKQGRYIALGVALGMLMGVAWDNIPIGLAFGLAVGAVSYTHLTLPTILRV